MAALSLQSTRLCLRPLTLDDAQHYARLLGNDSASVQMTATHPDPCTEEAARHWLAHRLAGDEQMFAITRLPDGEFVGAIGLLTVAPTGVVGYWIGRAYGGQGYATEALQLLINAARDQGVNRLRAETFPTNTASQRVLLKTGFVFVGQEQRFFEQRGGWRAVNQYELTLEEQA